MTRPRVLLIAEAANPEWVSVPLVGWSLSQALRTVADVHLVTQVRNREAIVRAGLREGADFTVIDSEAVSRRAWQCAAALRGGAGQGWTTSMAVTALTYPYFEHLVWGRFKREIRGARWDIVHRITPLSPTVPSLLAQRCRDAGVAFMLGPLNGGIPWPRQFFDRKRQEKEWLSAFRDMYRLVPGYASTLRHARAVLAGSLATLKQLPRQYRDKCFYLPENAVDERRFVARRTHRASKPIRIVFVGRLVPYKGADMLIDATAPLARSGVAVLDVIGDGPQMPELQRLVAGQGLEGQIRLKGWMQHDQLQRELAQADVFGFPSIREFGGGAVLEAMAVGLVPIVVNYGGPAELVDENSGFRVALGSRMEIVQELRSVLEWLAADPSRIDSRSRAAALRVHELYTWKRKAECIRQVYEWILGQGPKPGLESPASALKV